MKRSLVALTVLALVGCSTPLERRQASGGFEYEHATSGSQLQIPGSLQQPNYDRQFDIPKLGPNADSSLIGQRIDVRPPLQVLPLAPGTRLQDGTDSITVLVESNDDDRSLSSDINEALLGYLTMRKIAVASNSNGVISTDWIEEQEVVGKSWWREQVYKVRQRYQFDVAIKDHGRSGSITISVLAHEEGLNDIDEEIVLTDADKRRYAIDMLNGAISYLNFERTKQQKAKQLANGRGFNSELGFDSDGNSAYIAQAPIEQVWSRMQKLLPVMGFQIRDMDRQLGTLFVEFSQNSGFWDNLWGGSETLPLEDGPYQVKLVENGATTSVTFFDNDAQPLSAEQITAMGNTFRELVKKELKDL
ncbi:outer membrane protein assembly factor BamC [uncultured Ferrimonas sp.]|uniref:outer membrane protein assembly factor BamC n=1 Tax=uncultured Ferrimonas sp. TaxID=432640 RepID=UPI00263232C0|nr:outer membrane protein assembly factor BamC [uncultured Ferrimonas sp.]